MTHMPPGEPTEWHTPLLHEVGAQFDNFSRLWKMQPHMVSRFAEKCAQHGLPDDASAPAAESEDDATADWRPAWPVMPDLPPAVVKAAQAIHVWLREQGFERGSILGLRFGSDEPESEALRDMLEDARADLRAIRTRLGVPHEPHQSLQERTLEAIDRLKAETPAPYQRTHWRSWPGSVPPLDAPVLVWRPSWPYAILYRYIGGTDGTEWADLEGRTTVTHSTLLPPTHWMPQPAPPDESSPTERLTPFPPKPVYITTPGGPDFSWLWRASTDRPDPVHIMPQLSREEVWLRAWCAFAASDNCSGTAHATTWADECFNAFDKRFGLDLRPSP